MLSRTARAALSHVHDVARPGVLVPATLAKHGACVAANAVDISDCRRSLHSTAPAQNSSVIIAGSFAVAAGAIGLRYALVVSWQQYLIVQRVIPMRNLQAYEQWRDDPSRKFNAMRWHYRGGFEDEMTLSEAAKILGIRESSSIDAVRKAHRKLMILNHPDAGGSTFIAGKVNEAKEKLLTSKGKKEMDMD